MYNISMQRKKPRKYTRLTPEQKIELCNKYESGITGTILSKEYIVDIANVYKILRKHNIKIRGVNKFVPNWYAQMIARGQQPNYKKNRINNI